MQTQHGCIGLVVDIHYLYPMSDKLSLYKKEIEGALCLYLKLWFQGLGLTMKI